MALQNDLGRLVLLTKPSGGNAGSAADIRASTSAAPIKPTPTDTGIDQLRRQYTKYIANNFITKTCLTTFTYLTNIHVQDGKTSYESHEQVIKNVATERYVAPDGLAADKLLLDFHSTIIEPSESFNPQLQTEIQSTIFAVEVSCKLIVRALQVPHTNLFVTPLCIQKTPDLSVATQYTTYSYRNEILSRENGNDVEDGDDVQVQLTATESVKVIKNLVTVPYFEGSTEDHVEPTQTTAPTTIFNTYLRPLQKTLTLRQIVKTVINNEPQIDLEDEIDSSPVEPEQTMTTTPAVAIIENFKKLAPVVLNAMADLLQKLPGNTKQKPTERPEEGPLDNATFKKPIYIPVNSESGDLVASSSNNGPVVFLPEKKSSASSIAAQQDSATGESELKLQILDTNHFLPPNIGAPNLELNEHEVQVLSNHKNELHLMDLKLQANSPSNTGVGIPISPGEIINTNSDVIIGRPSLGIKPRLPNSVNSIPLQAHIHHHNQNVHTHQQQQIHNGNHQQFAQASVKDEVYHGPPPPPPQSIQPLVLAPERKPIPLKIHSSHPRDPSSAPEFGFNVPPNRPPLPPPTFQDHPHSGPPQQFLVHGSGIHANPLNAKHPDAQAPIHFYQKPMDHLLKPQYQNRPPNPSQQHHQHHHIHHHHHRGQNQQHNNPQHHHQHSHGPHTHGQGTPQLISPAASISVADSNYIGNDILEIKPIPEVYSTDLPPVLVKSHSGPSEPGSVQINPQPSQVTNVVIPSRNDYGLASVSSGSAASFSNGNVVEQNGQKFTYGKYFSEPSPYQGQDKLEFYTNKPQLVVVDNGKSKEVRPNSEPNPTYIQFQPNAPNEISVHASPIQFQQTIQVVANSQFDDMESDQVHRDEPILVSTSNRISSVSSLDGKTQIKVSEQSDDRDTQDIVVQNHFNFNSNVRNSVTTTSTTPVPLWAAPARENNLGPFQFNQNHNQQANQLPVTATNQVLINNNPISIDVQLSSQLGNGVSSGGVGQVLPVGHVPQGVHEIPHPVPQLPPIRINPSGQRPHKGERFPPHYHNTHHHHHHPHNQRFNEPVPPPPQFQQLPSPVQIQTFNKNAQNVHDSFDRMTSKAPAQNEILSRDQQPPNTPVKPVPSTDHYDHDSYGQSPPPPPTAATPPPPPSPPKFKVQPQFWNGPPGPKPSSHPGTPYPFDKGPELPTSLPKKRIPSSPIQGPSTLQSHNKQQQEIQSGVNDAINEILGGHLSIMTPPPAPSTFATEPTTGMPPLVVKPQPEIRSPIIGDHGQINLKIQTPPQTINNEFHQLIQDNEAYANSQVVGVSTGAPQHIDIQSFTTPQTTPSATVDSQTEYNGLKEMSKYHHIERKPPAHPQPHHHKTSMKISRVPQRPPLPTRNVTFAGQAIQEGGNNGDVGSNGQVANNVKTSNSRGTSKFYYNLSHKPYQSVQHQRLRPTTVAPIGTTTTIEQGTPSTPAEPTISSVRVRLPQRGSPFHKTPVSSTPVNDQMAMDLTPPPVRPIELSYGQGFHKPSKFDSEDNESAPQDRNTVYQTIKRPIQPTTEEAPQMNITSPMAENRPSYWDTHREPVKRPLFHDEPVRNRGPPPTMSHPVEEYPSSSPSTPRRTSIHDRRIVPTQGPYEFETAEPDIITVPNGKDDSVFLKASWGPPYAFEEPPKQEIIVNRKPEAETSTEDLLGTGKPLVDNDKPAIDLVLFQAPRTPVTTTMTNRHTTTMETTTEMFEDPTTTEAPVTTTPTTTTSTTPTTTEATTTESSSTESDTETVTASTTRTYAIPVRLRPKISLSTTTTRKPILSLRGNATHNKPGDRGRTPFLRPSISVVQLNAEESSTTTTEVPLNKTDSIFVVMRPANQQPVIPHQHRPAVIITRKPDVKRPIDFHPVTRDEDDAFHTNSESRLVLAGVHHIQDNGFPSDNKKFGGKISTHGDTGNHFLHTEETGPSANEDPIETGPGTADPSPDDYVVCEPGCSAAKNEKCILFSDPGIETQDGGTVKYTKCACRPGFGRMFPDRPCKRKFIVFCLR